MAVERVILARIDSTMAEAERRLRAAPPKHPTWILALAQEAGYGRRGRAWRAPLGNFTASLILPLDCTPQQAALRSFTAALALRAALAEYAQPDALSLKWPNDVLLNGQKIAGILLQSHGVIAGQRGHLVIGIGVNLRHSPEPDSLEEGALAPTDLFSVTGQCPEPEAFLDRLAPRLAHWEWQISQNGFAPVRAAWMAHAAKRGEVILARLPNRDINGVFDDIDDKGNLILTTANGPCAIAAADIYF